MNHVERFHLEVMFVAVAAEAIQRRHPASDWLVERGHVGHTGLTDRALEAAVERLGVWLDEQREPPTGTG